MSDSNTNINIVLAERARADTAAFLAGKDRANGADVAHVYSQLASFEAVADPTWPVLTITVALHAWMGPGWGATS